MSINSISGLDSDGSDRCETTSDSQVPLSARRVSAFYEEYSQTAGAALGSKSELPKGKLAVSDSDKRDEYGKKPREHSVLEDENEEEEEDAFSRVKRRNFNFTSSSGSLFQEEAAASSSSSSTSSSSSSQLTLPRVKKRQRVANAARLEWAQKQPMIALGNFYFDSKEFKLERVGDGVFHKVFKFAQEGTLSINGHELFLSDIVLKILNGGSVGPNKLVAVSINDQKGYMALRAEGVPVVEIYADPISIKDPANPKNGMFWIVEKMHEEITGDAWQNAESFELLDDKSQAILNFAKHWLTRMAVEERDIINDFRKRNTMMKGDEIKIVDYGEPEEDQSDVTYLIGRYVMDWANGNEPIFNWLIREFPDHMKPVFYGNKK